MLRCVGTISIGSNGISSVVCTDPTTGNTFQPAILLVSGAGKVGAPTSGTRHFTGASDGTNSFNDWSFYSSATGSRSVSVTTRAVGTADNSGGTVVDKVDATVTFTATGFTLTVTNADSNFPINFVALA